jgi:hypothetical protein
MTSFVLFVGDNYLALLLAETALVVGGCVYLMGRR